MEDLGTLPGDLHRAAADVNDSGTVTDAATINGNWAGTSAATWNMSGAQTMLPSLPGAARHSVTGLSEVGQVIGVASFANGTYRGRLALMPVHFGGNRTKLNERDGRNVF